MYGRARERRPNATEVKLKCIWDSHPTRTKKEKEQKKRQRNLLDELLGYMAYISILVILKLRLEKNEHIFYHAFLREEFETRLWSYASIMDKNVEDAKFQIYSMAD